MIYPIQIKYQCSKFKAVILAGVTAFVYLHKKITSRLYSLVMMIVDNTHKNKYNCIQLY